MPLLAALVLSLLTLRPAPAEPEPAHLTLARDLLRDVAPADSDYQHRPTIVRWWTPQAPAVCRADCSGLINSLLKEAYHLTSAQLESWLGRQRPLALQYETTIESGRNFDRIVHVQDIRPGDIIAVRYPPDSDNSGHVMLVDAAPEARDAAAPIQPGTTQWFIRVIDSTKVGHGTGDSRLDASAAHPSDEKSNAAQPAIHPGLGSGTIRVYENADHSIAGYTMSPDATAKFHPITDRPLAIGRVHIDSPPSSSSTKP